MNLHDEDTQEAFLRSYDATQFERPNTCIDTVIFTVKDDALHVLTVKRAHHPFKGSWSLVGGYVDVAQDEDLLATAKRKLKQKTGVDTPYLEQCMTIGNKHRDPRGWSVTTVYVALIPHAQLTLHADHGAADTQWLPVLHGRVDEALAFDHADILLQCTQKLRSKVLYTSLPVFLMPTHFTLGELQKVYELILDKKIDHKSFRRRILAADILEEVEGLFRHETTRPAQIYRVRYHAIHFFMRNIEGAS